MEVLIIALAVIIVLGIILFGRKKNDIIVEQQILSEEERYNINKGNDFNMIVEDIFTITGKGTVITGKIDSGLISINEEADLYGVNGLKGKVTILGIEMFRKTLDYAQAEDNVGLLLGDISKNDISRGDTLTLRR